MNRNLIPILLLAIAAAGFASWGWRADAERRAAVERVGKLETELKQRGVSVPAANEPHEEPSPTHPESHPSASSRQSIDVGKYLGMIDQLRARTGSLETELQEARSELDRTRDRSTTLTDDAKKTGEQLASIKEDLQKQQRIAEALDTELKFKSQRLTQTETSEKLLQEKLAKAEQAAKRNTVSTKEMEDLSRRREAALTSLERRYREVTDLYRSFSLNLQTRETTNQGGMQAGDLSRIQGALQQAEEELRQLRSLNGRVAELTRGK